MSENIDYAEMLEIPVSTLNVTKKRSRKKREPAELKEQVVESVNERLEPSSEVTEGENFTDYGQPRVVQETALPRKRFLESGLLVAEFVAVCVLCAAIVLTNLLWENSAINTFFRGLVQEETPVAAQDDRSYSELTLRSVVSDASVVCSADENGVLSFTGECSVYAPCAGTVQKVYEGENGYSVEISHTTSFTTVIAGLTNAYVAAGDTAYSTIPIGFSAGETPVTVSMYDSGSLIRSYTVGENNDIVWSV